MIRAFSLAVLFLTRLPVPLRFVPGPQDWGRSVFFFPLVGLLIGAALAGLGALLGGREPAVQAVTLLMLWTLLTGNLHLDGLADTADAWSGGHGDREKTLSLMKDPRSGPSAIVAVGLILLVKFAALQGVVERQAWDVLVGIPVLGRAALLLLLLTTPYVRPQGIGADHAAYLPRTACLGLLLGIGAAAVWRLGGQGIGLLVLLGAGFIYWRRRLLARLGGTTGDTLGATCEVTEAVTLLLWVLTG